MEVDSSDMAISNAGLHGFSDAVKKAEPTMTEPIMKDGNHRS